MPMIYQVGFDIWLVSSNVTREILLSMEVFIGIKHGKKNIKRKNMGKHIKIVIKLALCFCGEKKHQLGQFPAGHP
jgi:hypothetical protein